MNTTYTPVDRDFLFSLALAKAKGRTWLQISEKAKMNVVDLEIIPWREPKAWAKACKYAEKLVQHEALSESLATLRAQMNDNVNNARMKTQIANSVVRVIQQQQALRTPKKPKKAAVRPTPEPLPAPTATASPPPPVVNEPVTTSPPSITPKTVPSVPLATVAALLLLLLVGAFTVLSTAPSYASETPIQPVSSISHTEFRTPHFDRSAFRVPRSAFDRMVCSGRILLNIRQRAANDSLLTTGPVGLRVDHEVHLPLGPTTTGWVHD